MEAVAGSDTCFSVWKQQQVPMLASPCGGSSRFRCSRLSMWRQQQVPILMSLHVEAAAGSGTRFSMWRQQQVLMLAAAGFDTRFSMWRQQNVRMLAAAGSDAHFSPCGGSTRFQCSLSISIKCEQILRNLSICLL